MLFRIISALLFFPVTVVTAQGQFGTVVRPVANLHRNPTTEADVVTQAIFGTHLQLFETKEEWVRVRMPDDYVGWMTRDSLYPLPAGAPPYAQSGKVAFVESLFANVYREPDVTRHAPLMCLPYDSVVVVIAEPEADNRRWLELRLPDGRSAWIQRGDVSLERRPLSIRESIELSKRFLGLPYYWGGTSSYGFDCSGFVQLLLRRRGILIPRDAGPQFRWEGFQAVPKDRLKPGDLLYFGSSEQKVTHTGYYLGRGRFIHATTHERPVVQISRLKEPHWTRLFVGARRSK
jgi:SH3-like domain-containing protein